MVKVKRGFEPVSYEEWQCGLSRYEFAARFVTNRVVLDVGCASCYGASRSLSKTASTVVAGDTSEAGLRYGRARYKRANVQLVCLDASEMPFTDACFEVVIALEVIEHIKEYRRFLSECRRVLSKGGIFICSTPNEELRPFLIHDPAHVNAFNLQELRELLCEYFVEVVIYGRQFVKRKYAYRLKELATHVPYLTSRIYYAISGAEAIRGFVTKFIFQSYRARKLEDINSLDKRYEVLPQNDSSNIPAHLVMVAKRAD